MQGRAAAVYGLVFLLVALAASAYVVTAEVPEPTMENPEYEGLEQGESFRIENDQGEVRNFTVGSFSDQRGQPTVTMLWTDETTRSTEEWTHAAEPGGTTVVYDGTEYYVRVPQTPDPTSFTLLQSPPEDGNVSLTTDESDNWIVNDSGTYVALADYEGLAREPVENGSTFDVGEGNDSRTVTVEAVTNESVTVSWPDPTENEALLRQTAREQLFGQNATVHFPGDETVDLTTDQDEIDRYVSAHDDRVHFQQRVDGLVATAALSLVALVLLLSLSFLPRKE